VGVKASEIPVYLVVRDRVNDLRGMVSWLEAAGQESITLLDNASTYPPLLDYLTSQGSRVHYLGANLGHSCLFVAGLAPETPFIYSDPDLVFLGPHDGVEYLWDVAQRYPDRNKVGFGLTLDGVREDMPSLNWEQELWNPARIIESGVFSAPIDTTFAIWQTGNGGWDGIRTGAPYVMSHTSWNTTPDNMTEEDRYYLSHVEGPSSSWAVGLGIVK
jgi:hypothetical protein